MKQVDRVENRQSRQLHNAPIGRRIRIIQPREVRYEDDWDPEIANRRHGGRFKEDQVREEQNSGSSKKKVSLFDPEDCRKFEELFVEAYRQSKRRGSLVPSQSPNTSSCEIKSIERRRETSYI